MEFVVIILFYIFIIFMSAGQRSRRRNTIYSFSSFNNNLNGSFTYSSNTNQYSLIETHLSSRLVAFVRRRIALNRAKNYVSKFKNSYSLKNKNTTLIYSYKDNSIACMNLKDRGQNFKVNWTQSEYDSSNYMFSNINTYVDDYDLKNLFAQTFDTICIRFNRDTTFADILAVYRETYKVEFPQSNTFHNTYNDTKEYRYVDDYVEEWKETHELIDINKATLEEIKNLPGISVIMAKRIIKYRDENKGFTSKAEFYEKFNIQPHFQAQLNNLIYISGSKSSSGKKIYDYDVTKDESLDIERDNVIDFDEAPKTSKKDNPPNDGNDRIIDI